MRHTFNANDINRHFNGKNRPPLRTATELALEFGLSRQQLAYYLGKDANAPKPVLKHTGTPGARNTWYNPAEMRAWWKRHNVKLRGAPLLARPARTPG